MLTAITQWLQGTYPEQLGFLRVFQYLTFRAVMAALTALLIGLAFGPWVINRLTDLKFGQPIREYGVKAHLAKAGTPTMGGVLIILSCGVSTLLWAELTNWYTVLCMLALLWMGLLGFLDDYLKVIRGKTEGLVARYKLLGQFGFGLGIGLFLLKHPISPLASKGIPVSARPTAITIFFTCSVRACGSATALPRHVVSSRSRASSSS